MDARRGADTKRTRKKERKNKKYLFMRIFLH